MNNNIWLYIGVFFAVILLLSIMMVSDEIKKKRKKNKNKSVSKRSVNNIKKIVVKSKTWQKQHEELWQMLVPSTGAASSIQGELIRIVGKATDEIYRNGGANWEYEYPKMMDAIPKYIKMGKFDKSDEIIELSKKINANSDKDELYLLSQLIVEWVLANPDIIELKNVDYKR